MTLENLHHAVVMFAAGIGIPVLAVLNAQLGSRIGSPAAAATILFVVALSVSGAVLLVSVGPAPLALAPAQPIYFFLGGVLVAFYVLSITWIAPRFGVGNAIFCVLLGQLVSAAVIDHFGLAGAAVKPLGLARASGIGLMALGVLLTQRA